MKWVSNQAIDFAKLIEQRQNDVCGALSSIDDAPFQIDEWNRPGGGGGNTRILESATFEKAGVNTSRVFGKITSSEVPMFTQLVQKVDSNFEISKNTQFFATGISLVIHPKNPFIPTVHANYRYFEINTDESLLWWMGGGADLTPYYLIEPDIQLFHQTHYNICEAYKSGTYQQFKDACDQYFYLPHRKETRGVGGIFFDYLNHDFMAQYELVSDLSAGFIDAYIPIVKRQKDSTFTKNQREWQEIRRGRYAEFNLLYDRGTLFGLKTNGRIESILMSMPPQASWKYDHIPSPESEEGKMLAVLKTPRQWISENE